jgi:hypothetical protein
LLTIAFAPPLTVSAAVAELFTRTSVSVTSILLVPPAATRMPESTVCLTTVLETTSLPPLVRSSEMPRPVNPSIFVFSMSTEEPGTLLRILTPFAAVPAPLMSSQLSRTTRRVSAGSVMLMITPVEAAGTRIEP